LNRSYLPNGIGKEQTTQTQTQTQTNTNKYNKQKTGRLKSTKDSSEKEVEFKEGVLVVK